MGSICVDETDNCFLAGRPIASFQNMITIFTPSFADESDTNAQNLTVKEVVSRLDPTKFHVTMLGETAADPRIAARANTRILRWQKRGNTIRALAHLLRNVPDIYYFPREGPLDAGFLHLRRGLGLRTAVVTYVVSGGELDHGAPRATLARNIRVGDAIIGNSAHMTALLRDQMRVPAETIHDGVDRRYFFPPESLPKAHTPMIVLFAGSLRAYKRPRVVVEQAARWPGVEFRIAGLGEEELNCRAVVAERGCENVIFLGHLSPQQVGEEMRRADLFFFPSVIEGHPQVLVQAAASGLPVVAMNHYRPDFVIDGKTGLLATSDADLAEKLDLLLTKHELRESMGEAAVAHARQFDWESATKRWESVFERVVAARKNR
jgi:glycosyltransferase involved in cell wall biosynthesis